MRVDMNVSARQNQVVLSCLHIILLRAPLPAKGDEHWCMRCGSYRFVGIVNSTEWTAQCEHDSCRFTRRTGQSKYLAERQAQRHELMTGHYCVVTLKGTNRKV